ncbi:30S ribosomal protein S4 [Candidatus Giovannonibacteria bacterium RIFCSPLOWO2_02_FULL_45_14]|uniref:Small ribosomal subunit protein uS4 n=1 Tax=Candidatus Giovannonibacteria bacterium RIFCSPLOWO2_12_FULL_44_15 TaxID=1798364 RepID=A0A1F5Y0X6_9BACT|nr:MAG: 30S ribosomal protein S4 [Candidatus Giovannonibacteria bacterium RIFCSPHIGHO2_02_FULL_44_31]OGF75914.1 MAG: 30S ribosomal protein S4 [Candidatus Giovannonibacteria bacterium RIFCSPHIGHO2_12_FULL_44_29]OGF90792.1 MAG: 30S ribosomal protein S4 [Candidatus Giovannonibacteria bacterium RIFCSPLOWO2_02_FULL_45_14]OGF93847.1 MAG: 30S ribosomal protein S4 [Candidatus Giovannonibacteria bacterium RIFCSPLOWO2_12_FULL_44_15]
MRISCKICRRLGMSICGREKCAFKRKPYAPGEHGKTRKFSRASSEFGAQLKEKQKLKFLYNLRERQFRNYIREAEKRTGDSGENLMKFLESRLDNAVYRLGFAQTRTQARQGVTHGHFMVNGRRVNIPSFRVKKDDKITIKQQSLSGGIFRDLDTYLKKYVPPAWLSFDKEKKEGVVLSSPATEDDLLLGSNINLKAIIEFYSR